MTAANSARPIGRRRSRNRGEEVSRAQLRDLHRHVAGLGQQKPVTTAVSPGDTGVAALIAAGADVLSATLASIRAWRRKATAERTAEVVAGANRSKQLGEVRLNKGPRVTPFDVWLVLHTEDHPAAHLTGWTPAFTPPGGTSTPPVYRCRSALPIDALTRFAGPLARSTGSQLRFIARVSPRANHLKTRGGITVFSWTTSHHVCLGWNHAIGVPLRPTS